MSLRTNCDACLSAVCIHWLSQLEKQVDALGVDGGVDSKYSQPEAHCAGW